MSGRKAATLIPPILAALSIVALTLYAYRDLAARPFAADDYQWLLSVRGLDFGALLSRAFDPAAQTHFYRPLVWLLFWLQTRAFGLDPRGFHAVSLALHLLNAALLGGLVYRLQIANCRLQIGKAQFSIFNFQFSISLLAMAIVALHPAPFEAVVWISAQSELLAAALLLVALHVWLPRPGDQETRRPGEVGWRLPISPSPHLPVSLSPRLLVSTLALGLALLAKESAVIGLPLLMLLGVRTENQEPRTEEPENPEPRTQNRRTEEPENPEPENRDSGDTETRRHGDTEQVAGFSIFNSQFPPAHARDPGVYRAPDCDRAAQLSAQAGRLWNWDTGHTEPAAQPGAACRAAIGHGARRRSVARAAGRASSDCARAHPRSRPVV